MASPQTQQSEKPLAGCEGLLIDQQPTAVFRYGVVLQNAGAHVQVVADGYEAVSKLSNCRGAAGAIDFVCIHASTQVPGTAQMLPNIIRQIREAGFNGTVVVVAGTPEEGFASGLYLQCTQAGCDLVVAEQIGLDKLVNMLVEQLQTEPLTPPASFESQVDQELEDLPTPQFESLSEQASENLNGLLAAHAHPSNRLLQRFVEKLPARLESLQAAMRQQDLLLLETLLQQFKRSADAHGYTPLAKTIRQVQAEMQASDRDVEQLQSAMTQLLELCQDAGFATPPPEDDGPSVA